jgi:hypothetical protein
MLRCSHTVRSTGRPLVGMLRYSLPANRKPDATNILLNLTMLTVGVRVRSQTSPCGIFGVQSCTEIFFSKYFCFPLSVSLH